MKMGGAKKTSTNFYISPTSTIVPSFFRYQPTDNGFRFCSSPKNPFELESSPYTLQASSNYEWQQHIYSCNNIYTPNASMHTLKNITWHHFAS
jgi:hypothetical protein